jgi:hypothetical protein
MMTDTAPKPEPEVADRRRWPKPGGPEWGSRYKQTLELLKKISEVCPSTEPSVRLAIAELANIMADDCKRHGF